MGYEFVSHNRGSNAECSSCLTPRFSILEFNAGDKTTAETKCFMAFRERRARTHARCTNGGIGSSQT
jgi:hypothetical protein